jgi:excisionase family DNA binding protein
MSGQLLTAEQVAEMFAVKVSWVREQTRKGRIPHLKLGRYVRYRREAIEEWIRDNETGKQNGP